MIGMNEPLITKIAKFFAEIGIELREEKITHETFLPGIDVVNGALVMDRQLLLYPGDLLHEAGHLAVLTPEDRVNAGTTIDTGGGEEMAAIAWSYAAALYLEIDPAVVFHPEGYKGGSAALLDNFTNGHYVGVPLLAWMKMTGYENIGRAEQGIFYPRMARWLRE